MTVGFSVYVKVGAMASYNGVVDKIMSSLPLLMWCDGPWSKFLEEAGSRCVDVVGIQVALPCAPHVLWWSGYGGVLEGAAASGVSNAVVSILCDMCTARRCNVSQRYCLQMHAANVDVMEIFRRGLV